MHAQQNKNNNRTPQALGGGVPEATGRRAERPRSRPGKAFRGCLLQPLGSGLPAAAAPPLIPEANKKKRKRLVADPMRSKKQAGPK